MAVDVNKLIAEAKAAQATARAEAEAAAKVASRDKANAEVAALSKKQLDYANSLKSSLKNYETQLKGFAAKLAVRKLNQIEQKEFEDILKKYNSVNNAIDASLKKANDILVEARRAKSQGETLPPPVIKGPTGPDAARTQTGSTTATKPTGLTGPTGATGGARGGTAGGNAAIDLAKKEAAKTKAIAAKSKSTIVPSDYAQRNVGISGVTPPPAETGVKTSLNTLLEKTDFWYDLPDYIFKVDVDPKTGEPGEIGRLLQEAVAGDWKNEKFLSKLQLTKWWQRNAPALREKIIQREKYNDLVKAGEDVKNTEYGMYLSKQMRAVKAKAKELANVTLTDEQAQSVAQKIYDGNLEDDPLAINALIVPFIGKTTSIVGNGLSTTGFGGQALQNYQMLQGIAKANGFSLKDILPNVSAITAGGDLETAVLRGLADGSIDINRVAQDARMLAAQGQPEYVRNLLNQGYDLEAVYAPYRKLMATTLDLNPDQIDLNDPTLRSAITDKGDMNLYDFRKNLRKDNRWQYTSDAREEVGNSALKVLQDFGFQG